MGAYETALASCEAATAKRLDLDAKALLGYPKPSGPPDVPIYEQYLAWMADVFELDYPNAVARIPTIYSCVTRISDDIASLPMRFQEYDPGLETWVDLDQRHPVYRLWRDEPNAEQSGYELVRDIQASQDMVGNSYLFLEHGARGPGGGRLPDELWETPGHLVKPIAGPRRSIKAYEYTPTRERWNEDQMIPFRYWNPLVAPSPVSPVGLSPLSAARAAFMSRFRMGQWQDKFFETGGSVSHLFSVKDPAAFKPEQLEKMEKLLNKKRGLKHAFEARVVSGVELLRAGITPREMQFIEAAQLTDKDICQVYKVPPVIIGIKEGGGMSDAGATTDTLLYAEGCLSPRARLMGARITRKFCSRYMPGIRCVVDTSGLMALQKAALDQAAAVVKLTGRPILTLNEGRKRVGEQPSTVEGADDPYVPTSPFDVTQDPEGEDGEPGEGGGSRGGAPQRRQASEDRGPEDEPASARRSTRRSPRALARAAVMAAGTKEQRAAMQLRLRRRVDKDLARYERRMTKWAKSMFKDQEEAVLAALRERDPSTITAARQLARVALVWFDARVAAGAADAGLLSLSIWDELIIEEPADLEAAQKLYDQLIAERGEAAAAEIGEEVALDVNATRLRQLIDNRASRLVKNVNATTRDRLTRALANVVATVDDPDATFDATVAAVRDVFRGRRDNAETIARTETMWAYNKGAEVAWRESGVRFKSWVTANDEAVRDSHQLCEDAGVIPFDSLFPNGLLYPGDENGPADEVINCRCVLQPEFGDEDDAIEQIFTPAGRVATAKRNGHSAAGQKELERWVLR